MARGIVEFNDNLVGPLLESHSRTSLLVDDVDRGINLAQDDQLAQNPYPRGVFSEFPSSTPKWLGQHGRAAPDFRETMARMFIVLDADERERFLRSVSLSGGDESRILASVLAGTNTSKTIGGLGYIDFLLQQADHQFQEKSQVVETLADNYVIYYFGAAAVPFSYSGTVLNTFEDDQAINMIRMYRDMIRGTQLARRRKLLRLRYNNMIVAGSVMGMQLGLSADPETSMSFSFQLMPKTVTLLPNPDFGVVTLKEPVGLDEKFFGPADLPTAISGGRLTSVSATNLRGGASTTQSSTVIAADAEGNAGQSLVAEGDGQSIE